MRLLGVLAWTAFLLASLFLYAREEKRRVSEYRGLVRLVSHLNDRLTAAPRPLPEIFSEFEEDALKRTGFLDVLQRADLTAALVDGGLHLSGEELQPFTEFAAELGSRLYIQERQKTEELLHHTSEVLRQTEADFSRKRRLAATMFFTGGMLLLLLLL